MFDESGGSNKERVDEAKRLLRIIGACDYDELSDKDRSFVESIENSLECYAENTRISPKQLFYLRDIKDRRI